MRIGLVLGAGGAVGVSYHGAVLSALEEVTGWDPRRAEVIVGTSAGSITAAMLRAGMPATDLQHISEGQPLTAEGARLAAIGKPHRPRPRPADVLRFRPMADPVGAARGLARLPRHPRGALLAALLPAGGIPTEALSTGINAVFAAGWPSEALWLCAVRLRDGKRVVFGRDGAPEVGVGDAVAASSAIPGYFRPVELAGRRYVDGGVRSLVNLDLMAGLGLDLVIVSSPLTRAVAGFSLGAQTLVRQPMRLQLRAEVAALRRNGLPVAAIEPAPAVVAAMGFNPMDARQRGPVSRATRAATVRWLAGSHEGRWLVAMLACAAGAHPAGAHPAAGAHSGPDAGRLPTSA